MRVVAGLQGQPLQISECDADILRPGLGGPGKVLDAAVRIEQKRVRQLARQFESALRTPGLILAGCRSGH